MAQRVAARHELAEQQATVIEEVRQAYSTYEYARQALADAKDKLLPVQRQQQQLAQLSYSTGDADLTTLLLAETEVQLTLSKILELQEKVTVAQVKLQRAAGGATVADNLEAGATPTGNPAAPGAASKPAATPTSQPSRGIAP